MELEEYTNHVVAGLLNIYPDYIKKYVGMNAEYIEQIICERFNIEDPEFVLCTVEDHWEMNTPVEEAIQILYNEIDMYVTAQCKVM
jgi:hypothetical protein